MNSASALKIAHNKDNGSWLFKQKLCFRDTSLAISKSVCPLTHSGTTGASFF